MNTQLDLLAQIDKLRRDLFWSKCATAVLFLCLTILVIANWTRHPKTVEASEFLVKDRFGNVVAKLGQSDFGDTCLTLTAKQSVSVASLCVQDEEGSSLDLHNLKSDSRATLTPGFNSNEPNFHFQPALVINEGMNSHFVHINLGTETKLTIGAGSKDIVSILSRMGEPKITLFGVNEKPIWSSH